MPLLKAFVLALMLAQMVAAAEPLVLVQTIQLTGAAGKLDHLAVDSEGQRVFLANKANNSLDIVDLKTGKLAKQIVDQGKASGVAYASDLNMIYVGNGAGTCNAFDGKDYNPVFSTPSPDADNVKYHSGNQQVYVGMGGKLGVVDAKTGSVKATIELPGDVHGFRVDKKAARIYAVLTKDNLIGVIDVVTNKIVDKYPLTLSDAGSPITQDAKSNQLFVGCPKKKPMIVIFDTNTGKEKGSIDIPAGVDDIHFDSARNRLYASCSDGNLAVLERDGESFKLIAKIATPENSRTCAWSKGRLYIGIPRQEGKPGPEIRVYQAEPQVEATADTAK